MDPIFIPQLVPPKLLHKMVGRAEIIKNSEKTIKDSELFFREVHYNDKFFMSLHLDLFTPLVQKITRKRLKPSYNFLAFYSENDGICPVHLDREQCFVTLDICLSQNHIWPLFVNSIEYSIDQMSSVEQRDQIKSSSTKYELSPGDALIYFGTKQPHWRERITKGNFCNLIFFHFVDIDFQGDLS